jgi:hypothetical protein
MLCKFDFPFEHAAPVTLARGAINLVEGNPLNSGSYSGTLTVSLEPNL